MAKWLRSSVASSSNELRNTTMFYDSEPEIDLFAEGEVIIYPNPSNGIIYFSTSSFENEKTGIEIYNVLGQKIFVKHDLDPNDNYLDLSNLAKGTYFITFSNENKKVTRTVVLN